MVGVSSILRDRKWAVVVDMAVSRAGQAVARLVKASGFGERRDRCIVELDM